MQMKYWNTNNLFGGQKPRLVNSRLMFSSATLAVCLFGFIVRPLGAQSSSSVSSSVPRQYLIYPETGSSAPTIVWSNSPPDVPVNSGVIALDSLSLKRRKVPTPSNIEEFVADKSAAIVLGKALFWDMQVGSDGMMACAS